MTSEHIFISYATAAGPFVHDLRQALERHGLLLQPADLPTCKLAVLPALKERPICGRSY